MDLVELLQSRGLRPRRTSTSHGGEYVCACPVCGDRPTVTELFDEVPPACDPLHR